MIKAIIVDDEPLVIKTLQKLLGKYSSILQVVAAFESSAEAIGYIKKTSPDVLFLDYIMPVMNGISLAREVEGHFRELIFVTGHDKKLQKELEIHSFSFLRKPINLDSLNTIVTNLVAKEAAGWLSKYDQRLKDIDEFNKKSIPGYDFVMLTKPDGNGIWHTVLWTNIILFQVGETTGQSQVVIFAKHENEHTKFYRSNTTLTAVEEDINSLNDSIKKNFLRINNKQIINLNHISSFSPKTKVIKLKDDWPKQDIIVSEKYPHTLETLLAISLQNRERKK